MKYLLLTACCGLTAWTLPAQTGCSDLYAYLKKGVKLEYASYDAKNKLESVFSQEVLDVQSKADTVVALISSTGADEKGKPLYANTYPVKCHAGVLYFDMQSLVPAAQQQGDMAMEIRGNDMIFPAEMQVGQALPDCDMEMKMTMNGMTILNTKYAIKNRKVEASEPVTTAAGTFDCFKISYDFEYALLGKRTDHVEYWYAKSKGLMIKTVSTDSKGKQKSRMELTKM
jgi:hypothetical protein